MGILPAKTTLTILAYGAILAATEAVPQLRDFKVLDWRSIPNVLDFASRKTSSTPLEDEQARLRPGVPSAKLAIFPIHDAAHAMDHFYEALRLSEEKKDRVVRILHYGDSPTTADLITADTRALLQTKFGDAGHGFCLIAKPWAWYGHRGIDIRGEGWTTDPVNQGTIHDGRFGLGGVSFRGSAGATAKIRLRAGTHTRVEIDYLVEPGGGQFRVEAGGNALGEVNTDGPTVTSGFASFPLPTDAGDVAIRVTGGHVRLFGADFERPGPGVIYHSLGVNGAYTSVLARFFRPEHWTEQLRHYRPDLVIVNYGTNESVYASFIEKAYERETKEVIRRLRAAVPEASILLMSPMDRGERKASGELGTVAAIPRLVSIQERVAAESGCAFFNTFEAMGGSGTMGRWYEAEPRLVGADFIHPMPAGAKIVGSLLYRAMLVGYNRYRLRRFQERTALVQPGGEKASMPAGNRK